MQTDRADAGVVARLGERYSAFDPGAMRLARGLQLALSIVVGIALGHLLATRGMDAVEALWGDWLRMHAPAYAGMFTHSGRVFAITAIVTAAASQVVLLIQPSSRRVELWGALQITAVSVAWFAIVGLAAPARWGYGALPMHIAWILVIAGGLYIRRYGQAGKQIGIGVTVLTLFAVLIDPGPGLGVWFPVAVLVGSLAGIAVRLLAWRPSAVRVFEAQRVAFLDTVSGEIAAMAAALGRGERPASRLALLRRRWTTVTKALDAASAEDPSRADRFARGAATAYRLLLAGEAMDDALAAIDREALSADIVTGRIRGSLVSLSRQVARAAGGEVVADPDFVPELKRAQSGLIAARDLDPKAKLGLMRLLTGVERIAASIEMVSVRIEPVSSDAAQPVPGPDLGGLGRRLAIQGLVAASITTGLNYAFHFEHAYWATLTVALVLTGTVGETVSRTIRRALGTMGGVILAIALSPLIAPVPGVEIALIFLAMMVAVMVIDLRYEVAAAMIGFAVVTGLHLIEGAGPAVMLARAYETFIGAGVALAVAWTVAPSFSGDRVVGEVTAFLSRCRVVFRMAAEQPVVGVDHTAPLEADVATIRAELPSLRAERWLGRSGGEALNEAMVLVEALVSYLGLFERASAVAASVETSAAAGAVMSDLDRAVEAGFEAAIAPKLAAPDLEDLLDRFGQVAPLDGSIPAAEAFALVERFYYGRRLGQTLAEFKTAWEKV
ncbi:FUSC family protein [Amorphus coralli]|uniref:FUSC family protein n=1 Tax=Amorphus coralli TaxID=340680 RepID=UPI000362C61D|nr:FUSC family protein [Amorphus coralli]